MLPKLVGAVTYGMFAAGALLASRLLVIPDSLATALYPMISREYAVAPASGARVVVKGLVLGLLVCVPIAALTFLLATQIALVLFPTQAEACAYVIRITMWGLPLWSIEYMMRFALTAAGKDAMQLRQNLMAAAVIMPLTAALVVGWGLAGACWAALLTPVVKSLALLPAVNRTFRVAGR
jgi:O-antigen/teichoic acid export membrane protein